MLIALWIALAAAQSPPPFVPPQLQGDLLVAWPSDAPRVASVVELELLVNAQGEVAEIRVVSGVEPFVTAARDAAEGLHFSPATESGVPVAVVLPLKVDFTPPPEVVLQPEPPGGEGILGTYRRERSEESRRTLSPEDVRVMPGTWGDPVRAVQNLPGVARAPLESGWLLVRGGNPRDTAMCIDGEPAPMLYHLGGYASIIHPAWVEQVDFFAGGVPSRYGDTTAGVVDLQTKALPDEMEVQAGANLILGNAYVAMPFGPWRGAVAVRRSYLDTVLSLVPSISEEQAQIAPRFYDGQARLERGPMRLFGYAFSDALEGTTSSGNQVAVNMRAAQGQGEVRGSWAGQSAVAAVHVTGDEQTLISEGADREQVFTRVGGGARLELRDDGMGPYGWGIGLDPSLHTYSLSYNALLREGWVAQPDAWVEGRAGQDARVVAGVRLQPLLVSGQDARVAVSPRLNGRWPIHKAFVLTGDLGLTHAPPPAELLVGPPDGAALEMERALTAGLGTRGEAGDAAWVLEGYARRHTHLTRYELDGSLGQGTGVAFGVDGSLKVRWEEATTWLNASLGRNFYREDEEDRLQPSTFDQPFALTFIHAVEMGKGWTTAGRVRYAVGYPTPASGDATAFDVLTQQAVPLDSDGDGRLDDFYAIDLKLSRRVLLERWDVEYFLDLQNATNHRIPEPVLTGILDTYPIPVYTVGLPVLPVFGVEGTFGGEKRSK